MPLLKNRLLHLRTITLRYIARNLELFWKEEWDPELQEVTEASDDILLNLPPVLRLEIYLFLSKLGLLDIKALLLLLDHKSLSGSIDYRTRKMFDLLNERYVSTLLARRCKRSTTLSLDDLSFATGPPFAQVLETFTNLTSLRLHSTDYNIVKLIGTSLQNLEELFLHHIQVTDLKYENHRAIECLVAGCPKLKILHVDWKSTLYSIEYLLLGLRNLVEFKHPLMVFALDKIIQSGKAERVSAIRNLYIGEEYVIATQLKATYVLKAVHRVMKHLNNITKLDITITYIPSRRSVRTFSVAVAILPNLTELTLMNYPDNVPAIIEPIGHQLKLLDLRSNVQPKLDVINQCRKLRVLRITVLSLGSTSPYFPHFQSYGSDLQEEFIPFQYLQELHLIRIFDVHFKPALITSLIASPALQDVKLVSIPIVTDHVVRAAVNHINQDGQQLAFTSLRRLELERHTIYTNYLIDIVSRDRVPLEVLVLNKCTKHVEVTLERFAVKTIYDKNFEYYSCY